MLLSQVIEVSSIILFCTNKNIHTHERFLFEFGCQKMSPYNKYAKLKVSVKKAIFFQNCKYSEKQMLHFLPLLKM